MNDILNVFDILLNVSDVILNVFDGKLNISDDLFKKGMTLKPFEANDQRTFGRELRIPRVKFKPGYQRL